MSFASPWVLLGLLAIPVLAVAYLGEGRRRALAAQSFVTEPLTPSVAPRRPGWRRHVPYVLLALALAVLIIAAARPQRSIAVPLKRGTVILANDVSNSMTSTDVQPSRLAAAQRAALTFLHGVPRTVQVGAVEFARRPVLLQSPTTRPRATRVTRSNSYSQGAEARRSARRSRPRCRRSKPFRRSTVSARPGQSC